MQIDKTKRESSGFTLIEVIVVLVILAILAAILIPSMVGWIGKADDRTADIQFNMMRKAVISANAEVDITEYGKKRVQIIIPVNIGGGMADFDKKFTTLVMEYLDPDMEGKYLILSTDAIDPNESLEDIISNKLVLCYYPNGTGTFPYYKYQNGQITKVE